jgi:Trypsin-co-occurring domain 1
MGYLLAVPIEPGSDEVLVVEVDRKDVSSDGLVLAANPVGGAIDRAKVSVEEAVAHLKPTLHKIVSLLKELSPEETEVEFGLKVGGETGMIIAKGTAEVNFAIRMTWKASDAANLRALGNATSGQERQPAEHPDREQADETNEHERQASTIR